MQIPKMGLRSVWLLIVAALVISSYFAWGSSLGASTLLVLLGGGVISGLIVLVFDRSNPLRYAGAFFAIFVALSVAAVTRATQSVAIVMIVFITSARLLTEIIVMTLRKRSSPMPRVNT